MQESDGAQRASSSAVSRSLLRYYLHDGTDAFRFELIGELSVMDLPELDGCWRTAKSSVAGRKLCLDLRQITDVDESGRQWLTEMLMEGTEYVVSRGFSEALAAELCLPAKLSLPSSPQLDLLHLLNWLKRWRSGSPAELAKEREFEGRPISLTRCDEVNGS
jgi:ABC-type transporter Mla MlaB component